MHTELQRFSGGENTGASSTALVLRSPHLSTCTPSPAAISSARITPLFSQTGVVLLLFLTTSSHMAQHESTSLPFFTQSLGNSALRAQVYKYTFKIPSPAHASGNGKCQHWPQLQWENCRTPADIPRRRCVIWG